MWTPPESAPPANLDTAQSVLLVAATALESAVHRASPARPVAGLVRPGLVRLEPTGSAARSRTTEPMTRGKRNSAWPIHALRTLRHVRKCSCTEPPLHFHHPRANSHLFVLGFFSHRKTRFAARRQALLELPTALRGSELMFKIISWGRHEP